MTNRATCRRRIGLFILVLGAWAIAGCSPEDENAGDGPSQSSESGPAGPSADTSSSDPSVWAPVVASHTSGSISRNSDIRVRFVKEQVSDEVVGRKLTSVPIRFEPPLAGLATWQTTRELRFLPAAPLESAATYRATVSLPGESAPSAPFTFGFRVVRQDFAVRIDGLTSDSKDQKHRVLSGLLTTSDATASEEIEALLAAEYNGKSPVVVWIHAADQRSHRFLVPSLERGRVSRRLVLSWNGAPIGVETRGERAIDVPPIGEFKVTRAKASEPDGSPILIYFSDNLDAKQNLVGLARVAGREVRTEIDGNILRAYPVPVPTGLIAIQISAGVRNDQGVALAKGDLRSVMIEARKPAVRFAGKGVILPAAEHLTVPIEAAAVDSVQVTAFQVYEDNIGRFLQSNQLDGQSQLHRVGRHLWRKTLPLEPTGSDGWERYSLDVSDLLEKHRGSLIRLTLSLNRGNSTYECPASDEPQIPEDPYSNYDDSNRVDRSNWDGFESAENPPQHADRNNPCKDAYFRFSQDVKDSRNFIASDIGLLAKMGDATDLHVVATDLGSTNPLRGVSIDVFNFQNQRIGEGRTNAEGMTSIAVDGVPFYLQAERGGQQGTLKLSAGTALATSHFEVGGEKVRKGQKGSLYGERGVWRPGDEIHLVFVAHDASGELPDRHPVTLTLSDPSGQRVATQTNDAPVGGFYRFDLETEEDAPTGRWMAEAKLGGAKFTLPLRIETVIPNRLKAELDFGSEELVRSAMPLQAEIFGQWLHGADGAGLDVDVQYRLRARPTRFDRNADFVFDDPTRPVKSASAPLFKGVLDERGRASFPLELSVSGEAPGKLEAEFTTRVFEESGAFSTERFSVPFHPFERYVGLRPPPGDRARGMLLTDEDQRVEIATVDVNGEPLSVEDVDLRLYKLDWRWWWDKSGESLAQYSTATSSGLISQGTISTHDGVGEWKFRIDQPEWGRYLLRACDRKGGHCSGKIVYIDWPGWAGRAQEQGGIGATALTLSSDQDRYLVGDTARITLPVASKGRMLISIETGSRILDQHWVEVEPGDREIEVPITREMAPTPYASVVLLQPHAGKDNDRPIRLYGYLPLHVEDPATRLTVQLTAPEEIRPKQPTRIEVREAEGQAMTYTIAIVDEGLLGLTRFKTPDLHKAFFAREALGIRTWDLFDLVAGAYGGELDRLLALGGGAAPEPVEQQKAKRRFPPVAEFLGPFELDRGGRGIHEFELPEYLGAVRIMVVGGAEGAYGSAEQSVFVRDRVMVMATLPRVLGPGESVALPVAVFATDPAIKRVDVRAEGNELLRIVGPAKETLLFEKPGDQISTFDLEVAKAFGRGHVRVSADGDGETASQEISIQVRNPNRETLQQTRAVVEASESWSAEILPHGLPGTNSVSLEISSVPPLNLERRLEYLIRYPYGCLEQTTSAAFPQLFLGDLARLTPEQEKEVQGNVAEAIERLRSFQRPDGSFSYWPGGGDRHDWATSYAGHLLVEAARQGYHVPVGMTEDWVEYQRGVVQSWVAGGEESVFEQAYRLYALALAGRAEIGAMNRLRESDSLTSRSRWMLAAGYQAAGVLEGAESLVRDDTFSLSSYSGSNRTFGTQLRDESVFLLGAVAIERFEEADRFVDGLSAALASDRWHSTQSTAWALLALSRYVKGSSTDESFAVRYRRGGGDPVETLSDRPIVRVPLENFAKEGESVEIENVSKRRLYTTVSTRGVPPLGKEIAAAVGLQLEVGYEDLSGARMDVARIAQGRDFVATVTVVNTRDRPLENVALTQVVSSGWEIHDASYAREAGPEDSRKLDHQDVRDDRVYRYFSLEGGQSKTFKTLLNAAYAGRFYLPPVGAEAMYDASVHARNVGRWVEVSGALE
jgi:uncharacterized protein YfaS (alpha-2-macroglobulin family)